MSEQEYLFGVVEIEVNSRCNRKCAYCPVAWLPTPSVDKFMDKDTFQQIISQLVDVRFHGVISYHFYNEPLLRKDLEKLVAFTKKRLPDAFQLLYTNGDGLTERRYQSLLAAGIGHFIVTRHGNDPISNRPRQTIQYPADLTLSNRGGLLKKVDALDEPLACPCFAPTDMLTITVDGNVLLCCDDSLRQSIFGNIRSQHIKEIWLSPTFQRIRDLLANGRRKDGPSPCRGCNNLEYERPGHNYYKHLVDQYR